MTEDTILLEQDEVMWVRGRGLKGLGLLVLTPKRILFFSKEGLMTAGALGGLIGSILADKLGNRKLALDIPISDIASVELIPPPRFKLFGRGKSNQFSITKQDNEVEKFILKSNNPEDWVTKLNSIL
jgi:hypothetical protein